MTIDLIILQYNHSDLTLKCLKSLAETDAGLEYRLIIVDNGSEQKHVLAVQDNDYHGGKMVLLDCNLGFAAGMNVGMRLSKADYVVLLNNDITFTPLWLRYLIAAYKCAANIAIVGAQTDNISSVQATERLKTVCKLDDPWYEQKDHNVAYFCTAISRDCIEEIGYLDEHFFNGGEDDDYNDRAREAGFKVGVAPRSYVHHDHFGTRKDSEFAAHFKENGRKNREYLRAKREARKKCCS